MYHKIEKGETVEAIFDKDTSDEKSYSKTIRKCLMLRLFSIIFGMHLLMEI